MAWYPHFMSDYDRDTQHLSLMENGAYQRLLNYYYDKRQPLPADNDALFRISRAFKPEEQAAVQAVIKQFFNLEADGWHQKRADEEIEKAKQISAARAKAARIKTSGKTGPGHSEGKAENETPTSERDTPAHALQNGCKTPAQVDAKQVHVQHISHNTDHNTQLTDHNSQVTTHRKTTAVSRADEPRAGSRSKPCDDDFIAELQASEAYKMLNVRLTYNRMLIWCQRNKKQATQNRLIGWLNREDLPMGNGNGSYQQSSGKPGSPGSDFEFKPRSRVC
jgi:uncharacterized protein YdaU (DUF1376 family)